MGLFVLVGCDVDQADMDDVVDLQESFAASSRAENITISGIVTDPGNLDTLTGEPIPLANVKVKIGSDSTFTDANGFYSISLEETGPGAVVKVELEDHVDLIFPVDFSNYADNATETWSMTLPETQDTFAFEPGAPLSGSFEYLGVLYFVDIPADVALLPIEIAVSPAGTVVGPGISGAFAITGIHIETPEEDFEFDNEVAVAYNPLIAAQNNGIGSINPAALEEDAPGGAAEAAEEAEAALEVAQDIIDAGGTLADATTAYIEELYDDADEVSVDDNGNIVIVDTVEGSVLPGTGVVTEEDTLVQIDEEGEPVVDENGEEEEVDLVDEETGETTDIPHQGTADGEG